MQNNEFMLQKMPSKTHNSLHDKLNYFNVKLHNYKLGITKYSHMQYRKSEYLDVPHGNSNAWRYMNTWKLTRLLDDSALYFPNANKLTDQYEVTIPESVLEQKRNELKRKGFKGRELDEKMASFHWNTNPLKKLVLINCWSVKRHESYALWKIYLSGKQNGVAIKTSVSNLRRTVINGGDNYPEEFFMGKVNYERHLKSDELSRLNIITTKKPFYDFEEELRLFILNYPKSEGGPNPPYDISDGRNVRVDLDELIDEIYISPFSTDSYKIQVKELVSKSTLSNYKIKESEIRDQ